MGLRREAVTQGATYVSLITDYGYPRETVRFEIGDMDVAVFGERRKVLIYAENKASDKVMNKLCGRLARDFSEAIPPKPEDGRSHDDALMKAWHLWIYKPRWFWAVSPTADAKFEVEYRLRGFTLHPAAAIPSALEWDEPALSPAAHAL